MPSYRAAFAFIHLPPNNAVILDLGCSTGGHVSLWRREGNHVIGADTDEKAIATARMSQPNTVFYLLHDSLIPLPDNSVDVVIMLDVIEHVENEKITLTEIWRILKPGGRLILTTPYRNIFGDWMDGDNLFFIPLYCLKNRIFRQPTRFYRHRHYTTADILKFCPDKFEVEVEEITGGFDTAFFFFCTKLLGKLVRLSPPKLYIKFSPIVSSIQFRLKSMSQNSHFHRRKQSLACKLNIVLRRCGGGIGRSGVKSVQAN